MKRPTDNAKVLNMSPITVESESGSDSNRSGITAASASASAVPQTIADRMELGITNSNSLGPLAGAIHGLSASTSTSASASPTSNSNLLRQQNGNNETNALLTSQQYGTFDVSFVDLESEASPSGGRRSKKTNERLLLGGGLAFGAHNAPRNGSDGARDDANRAYCCEWCRDCWTIGAILLLPLRWRTWKSAAFHVATCAFSLLATLWMVLCGVFWLASRLVWTRSCPLQGQWRMLVNSSLHHLLDVDSKLFNLVAPPNEQIVVFPFASHYQRDAIVYGMELCAYFSFLKLLCSGLPGIGCVSFFGWCLAAVYQTFVHHLHTMTSPTARAQEDMQADMGLLLAILSVYFAALLMHVLALFARHVTIFFCAEYLLYIE